MNRAERRRIMKKIPGYRKALHQASRDATNSLQKMFQEKWNQQEKEKEKTGDE